MAGAPLDSHRYSLLDYSDAFTKARKCGLGRTVHAGEGRSVKEIEVKSFGNLVKIMRQKRLKKRS